MSRFLGRPAQATTILRTALTKTAVRTRTFFQNNGGKVQGARLRIQGSRFNQLIRRKYFFMFLFPLAYCLLPIAYFLFAFTSHLAPYPLNPGPFPFRLLPVFIPPLHSWPGCGADLRRSPARRQYDKPAIAWG